MGLRCVGEGLPESAVCENFQSNAISLHARIGYNVVLQNVKFVTPFNDELREKPSTTTENLQSKRQILFK